MTKAYEYKSKYENPREVMALAEKVYMDQLFTCDICFNDFAAKDLKTIEFKGNDLDVCKNCEHNLPEEYPEDDDDSEDL